MGTCRCLKDSNSIRIHLKYKLIDWLGIWMNPYIWKEGWKIGLVFVYEINQPLNLRSARNLLDRIVLANTLFLNLSFSNMLYIWVNVQLMFLKSKGFLKNIKFKVQYLKENFFQVCWWAVGRVDLEGWPLKDPRREDSRITLISMIGTNYMWMFGLKIIIKLNICFSGTLHIQVIDNHNPANGLNFRA